MAGAELRFPNVVKDLKVNEAARLWDEMKLPLPATSYVIVFTARSGSSWLTSILSETKLLGYPEEYLNPNFVRGVATSVNATTQETFLPALQRRRKSPNGVFGIEVREVDVNLFGPQHFFKAFPPSAKFFFLWRENLVAQAVSLFRAVETKHFHSSDGAEKSAPPDYNGDALGKWMIHLAVQENANLQMLQQRRRSFINLCYEQITASREQTLSLFAKQLGVDLPPAAVLAPKKELQKVGDDWNKETEMRFRAECKEFVAKIEADRQIKPYILERANGMMLRPPPPEPEAKAAAS